VLAAASPAQLLAAAGAALRTRHSVHYVSTQAAPQGRVRMVGDAGESEGIQRIAFTRDGRTGHVVVVVANRTAYVRGDAFTLSRYMGIKPAAAKTFAGRWIRIPHSDRDYATVAEAVTYASTIAELRLQGPYRTGPETTVGGTRVLPVHGSSPPSGGSAPPAVLYLRAAGARLPVEERAALGSTHLSVTFSRWNERVSVRAPASSTPLATVEAATA
jgi:hypothetical protein